MTFMDFPLKSSNKLEIFMGKIMDIYVITVLGLGKPASQFYIVLCGMLFMLDRMEFRN